MEQLYYATSSWADRSAPAEVTIVRRHPKRVVSDIETVSARNTLWNALKSRLLPGRSQPSNRMFEDQAQDDALAVTRATTNVTSS